MGAASGLSGYISVSSADRCLNQRSSGVLASITVFPIVLLDLTVQIWTPNEKRAAKETEDGPPVHGRSVDASRPDQTLHPRSSRLTAAAHGSTRAVAACPGGLA